MDEALRKHLEKLVGAIERHGVAIQSYSQGKGKPPHSYTVGLTAKDHPELLVSGLSHELATSILNALSCRVLAGEAFAAGDEVTFLHPSPRLVRANTSFARFAELIYPDSPVRGLQLALPDLAGRLPWEPECSLPQERFGGTWAEVSP